MTTLSVDEIRIVKSINGNSKTRGQLVHAEADELDQSISSLFNKNFIGIKDKSYSLTDEGKQYLAEYDKIGIPDVFSEKNYPVAILKFLSDFSEPIDLKLFPVVIIKSVPHTNYGSASNEYQLVHYLEFNGPIRPYINVKSLHKYSINDVGREYLKHKNEENRYKEPERENISFNIGHVGDNITTSTITGDNNHLIVKGQDFDRKPLIQEESDKTPKTKSKIHWESVLKITAAILALIYAALKFTGLV